MSFSVLRSVRLGIFAMRLRSLKDYNNYIYNILYMTHTYQIVNIGNKEHKIITGSYPEQCDTYFKAIENRDFYSAYMLHMPYIERDCKMIQFEIDMLTRKQTLDDELDIISCLPKELLELEMKIKTT